MGSYASARSRRTRSRAESGLATPEAHALRLFVFLGVLVAAARPPVVVRDYPIGECSACAA